MKEEKAKFKTTKKDEAKYLAKSCGMFVGFVVLLTTFDIVWRSFMITLGGTIRGDSAMIDLVFTSFITMICVGFAGVLFYGWYHKIVANHVGRKEVYKMMDTVIEKADELDTKNNELELAIKILQQENGQLAQNVQDATANFDSMLSRYQALELEYQAYREDFGGPLKLDPGVGMDPKNVHFDHWALEQFAGQMRQELSYQRARRRNPGHNLGEWLEVDENSLQDALLSHMNETNPESMDVVDIANYAMFLWMRKELADYCVMGVSQPHGNWDLIAKRKVEAERKAHRERKDEPLVVQEPEQKP